MVKRISRVSDARVFGARCRQKVGVLLLGAVLFIGSSTIPLATATQAVGEVGKIANSQTESSQTRLYGAYNSQTGLYNADTNQLGLYDTENEQYTETEAGTKGKSFTTQIEENENPDTGLGISKEEVDEEHSDNFSQTDTSNSSGETTTEDSSAGDLSTQSSLELELHGASANAAVEEAQAKLSQVGGVDVSAVDFFNYIGDTRAADVLTQCAEGTLLHSDDFSSMSLDNMITAVELIQIGNEIVEKDTYDPAFLIDGVSMDYAMLTADYDNFSVGRLEHIGSAAVWAAA